MTASELAGKARQLANSKLAPVEDIEGRLARWRRTHDEMAETLAMAAQVIESLDAERQEHYKQIDGLLAERLMLYKKTESMKDSAPVGPVRRFLKLLWTR